MQAFRPGPTHALQIHTHGYDLLTGAGKVDHVSFRSDNDGPPERQLAGAVYVHEIALVLRCARARDGQLRIAVQRVGQAGVQNNLGALPDKRARGLRKPRVIANRYAEYGHVRDLECHELPSRLDVALVGKERIHLTIPRDDLSVRVDHRGGVVDLPVLQLVETARQQPDAVLAGQGAETFLHRAGERLGGAWIGAERAEFAEHDHVDPWKAARDDTDLPGHGVDIVGR